MGGESLILLLCHLDIFRFEVSVFNGLPDLRLFENEKRFCGFNAEFFILQD